jgi:serine/threonine-protein kinase
MQNEPTESPAGADAFAERLQRALGRNYVLERELGGGGMSRVFRAHESKLGRPVVIKTLPEEVGESISRERFRREVMVAATLQHPHIVGVLDAGDAAGLPYFVMPFVEGESLRGRLTREGPLSVAHTVSILRDVARALSFAHSRGIVHRDIKPDNILLAAGSAVVTDFGIAKAVQTARSEIRGQRSDAIAAASADVGPLTSLGTSLGTPAYMAPEQVAGDPHADHRADLYGLGATAYEMLTGRTSATGRTAAELLTAQLIDRPDAPSRHRSGIPLALEQLVMRCLEKDPARRPQSADEVLTLLDNPSVVSGAVASAQVASVRPALVGVRLRTLVIAGAATLVLAAIAIVVTQPPRREGANASSPATVATARAPTIGVLPLVSVSPDSTDNYIALGMTDELTSALARVRGIRVTSRSAAAAAQEGGPSVGEMAKRLGVSFLLEGTVQRDGKRLRVTARLVNGADGFTVWSDVFERSTDDLLAVQSAIASAIANAVRADLAPPASGDTSVVSEVAGTRDLQAYNEYLRGHFLLERRGEDALRQAVVAFKAALARDSVFARAWAELAQAYAVLPLHSNAAPDSLWPLAEAAAHRALALDGSLAAAHAALGNIYNGQLRWREGRLALERAIASDSTYAAAYQWLGENLLLNGDIGGARRMLEQAERRDPGSTIVPAVLALALGLEGNADVAIAKARNAVGRDPAVVATRVMLASVYLYAQRPREALRELEVARASSPGLPLVLGTLGYAYAITGNRTLAMAVEDTLQRMASRPGAASALAKVQIGLRDIGGALTSLERAVAARDPFFSSEPMASPLFDPIRSSPRFGRVIAAAGLDGARLASLRR